MLLPAPLGPTRPIISPGRIVRLMSSRIVAVAVAEADAPELDRPFEPPGVDRPDRLGDARGTVEDLEEPLGARRRPLSRLDHPAHRLEPDVKPADQELEPDEDAGVDLALVDLPGAERPDDQQTELGQQVDHRAEERPGVVDPVVGVQHVVVAGAEPLDLASLLGERLDDPDAGDGVGQHAGHLRPGPAPALETAPEPVADLVDEPGDDRERQEVASRQDRIERDEHDGRHRDHQRRRWRNRAG